MTTRENAPRASTLKGVRSCSNPTMTHDKFIQHPAGCCGCTKLKDHNVGEHIGWRVPIGEEAIAEIAENERLAIDRENATCMRLASWGFMLQPWPGLDTPYNLGGTANNAVVYEDYQVLGSSDNTVTLRGRNPKKVPVFVSVQNGNFIPGTNPRLSSQIANAVLPVGGRFEPLPPSVMANKKGSPIKFVHEPVSNADIVEFDIELEGTFNAIMEPYDLAFPPANGKYYARILWPAVAPDDWPNLQDNDLRMWNRITHRYTSQAVHEVFNSQGGSTRVRPEERYLTLNLIRKNYTDEEIAYSAIRQMVTTEDQPGGGWKTFIDLSAVDFVNTYRMAILTCHVEALPGDCNLTPPLQSRCTNCQKEMTGSYSVAGDRHCTAAAIASGYSNFTAPTCWKPDECDRFTVKGFEEGREVFPPTNPGDAIMWASFYNRPTYYVTQFETGADDYQFEKQQRSGPSIEGMAGPFRDRASTFQGTPIKFPWNDPAIGKRITFGERQRIVYGAWYQAPYNFTSVGGSSYIWDAATTPQEGWLSDAIGQVWKRGETAYDTGVTNDEYPPDGAAAMNVYNGVVSGESWTVQGRYHLNSEKTVVAVDVNETNDELLLYLEDFTP